MSETKFPDAGDVIPGTHVDRELLEEGLGAGFDLLHSKAFEDVDDEVMVNDSLGTIDPSDSTGTDVDKEVEAEETEREIEKRHE